MALVQLHNTVGTTATPIITLPAGLPYTAVQVGNGHTAAIFLGGPDVATTGATKGNQLATNTSVQIWLHPGDTLYAVAAAATADGVISVVFSGQ